MSRDNHTRWYFLTFSLSLILMLFFFGESRWQYAKHQRNSIRRYNATERTKTQKMEAFIVQLGYDPNGVDDE